MLYRCTYTYNGSGIIVVLPLHFHYMLMKSENPLVFISGWSNIPHSHMDGRRRMYTDEKLKREAKTETINKLINNQKSIS